MTASANLLECRNVGYEWQPPGRAAVEAVRGLDLVLKAGEFLVLVGPSGSGKTTLLKLLAGLMPPTSGTILFAGKPVLGPSQARGLIFQDLNLFPWLNVADQIAFGPRMADKSRTECDAIVENLLRDMDLLEWRHSYVHQLSGGQQQRVAIARALASDPQLILMDEPLNSLDYQSRANVQQLLLALWQRLGKTIVLVTHSIDEALLLADRVVMLARRPTSVAAELRLDTARPRDIASAAANEHRARLIRFFEEQSSQRDKA